MNAFSAWAQSHSAIVIAASIAALGCHAYRLVRTQRAFPRRVAALESQLAQRRGGTLATPSAWRRVRNTALFCLVLPGVFSILIWAAYLLGGRIQRDHYGVTTDLLVLSIAYPLGSVLMGTVLGLGMPLMRNFMSSSIVGIVAIAPLMIGIGLSMDNALTQWTLSDTVLTGSLTIVFGMALGYGATTVTRRRAAMGMLRSKRE